jgi:hypothetical protein
VPLHVEHPGTFVLPILCEFLLVSTNFPLWELDEEKRLLVITSFCGILNRDVAFFVGVNFELIHLSLACLSSSPPLTLEAYFVPIDFCVLLGILSCVGCLQHPRRTFNSKGFVKSLLSYANDFHLPVGG